MRGLGRELGGALGPQGGGENGSVLKLARKERSAVDFREREVEFLRPWTVKTDGVVHVGAQVEGEGKSGASTSPGDPGSKQLRALTHARGAARAAAARDREPVIPIGSL